MALASALSQAHHGEPLSSLLPVPWCDRPGTGDRASMPRELLLSLEWPGCAAGLQRGAGGGRPRRPDGRSALPEHPDVGRFFLPLVLVLVLGALAFPAQREGFLAAVGPSWPWGPWSPFPGRVAVGDAPGLAARRGKRGPGAPWGRGRKGGTVTTVPPAPWQAEAHASSGSLLRRTRTHSPAHGLIVGFT